MAMSYSAALSSSTSASISNDSGNKSNEQPNHTSPRKIQPSENIEEHRSHARRSPSPSQRPRTTTDEDTTYILTILTSQGHHERMTALRKKYFPPKIYKVDAHITLFHALPGSKLESSIIHVIEDVCSQTSPFHIVAGRLQKLGRRGLGVFIDQSGSRQIQNVHSRLLQVFRKGGWLSEQDSGGIKPHYTIMNKVDDESTVDAAFQELKSFYKPDHGTAEGLGLWMYDRGWWRWVKRFPFTATGSGMDTPNDNETRS